ncbi:MAG: glycosyltransferase family 39 protein [Caldilineaceae bacterium]
MTLSVWIVRLVSLAGGVAALVCTWFLLAHWFPTVRGFAMAVLAAVAFNPLFLFMSVSVSNDIWATALTAAVLWRVAVTPFAGPRRTWGWVLLGVLSGLAVLTKYSGVDGAARADALADTAR